MSGLPNAHRFITLEGPEGAGKSTLIPKLAAWLESEGFGVVQTREPGATDLGREVRRLLLNGGDIAAETELFLFLADRSHHVKTVILPALADGKVVLCDRYVDSTVVYQSVARGLDPAEIDRLNQFATGGLLPGMTLLLDLRAEIGLARETKGDRLDREPLAFHRAVAAGYRDLAEKFPSRFEIVDAEQEPSAVFSAAKDKITIFLGVRA
jgi:dTMP kinase